MHSPSKDVKKDSSKQTDATVMYEMDVESTQTAEEMRCQKASRMEDAATLAYDMIAESPKSDVLIDNEAPTQTYDPEDLPKKHNVPGIDLGGETLAYETFSDGDETDDDEPVTGKTPVRLQPSDDEATQVVSYDATLNIKESTSKSHHAKKGDIDYSDDEATQVIQDNPAYKSTTIIADVKPNKKTTTYKLVLSESEGTEDSDATQPLEAKKGSAGPDEEPTQLLSAAATAEIDDATQVFTDPGSTLIISPYRQQIVDNVDIDATQVLNVTDTVAETQTLMVEAFPSVPGTQIKTSDNVDIDATQVLNVTDTVADTQTLFIGASPTIPGTKIKASDDVDIDATQVLNITDTVADTQTLFIGASPTIPGTKIKASDDVDIDATQVLNITDTVTETQTLMVEASPTVLGTNNKASDNVDIDATQVLNITDTVADTQTLMVEASPTVLGTNNKASDNVDIDATQVLNITDTVTDTQTLMVEVSPTIPGTKMKASDNKLDFNLAEATQLLQEDYTSTQIISVGKSPTRLPTGHKDKAGLSEGAELEATQCFGEAVPHLVAKHTPTKPSRSAMKKGKLHADFAEATQMLDNDLESTQMLTVIKSPTRPASGRDAANKGDSDLCDMEDLEATQCPVESVPYIVAEHTPTKPSRKSAIKKGKLHSNLVDATQILDDDTANTQIISVIKSPTRLLGKAEGDKPGYSPMEATQCYTESSPTPHLMVDMSPTKPYRRGERKTVKFSDSSDDEQTQMLDVNTQLFSDTQVATLVTENHPTMPNISRKQTTSFDQISTQQFDPVMTSTQANTSADFPTLALEITPERITRPVVARNETRPSKVKCCRCSQLVTEHFLCVVFFKLTVSTVVTILLHWTAYFY